MKKIVLLMMALIITTVVMAEGVTPQQALEQARCFMQKREAAGSRMRKVPSAVPQLTLACQVSGLYLFNVADDGGYVVVSNDDRTTPILGFSDFGHVDVDNMPDNMRAWLQGYADEIAWLQEHDTFTTATARLSQRIPAAKADIAPLVSTQWGQGAPYNNLCPQGIIDKDGNWGHRPTGCVATAMAQVMKYHEWPATTGEIPLGKDKYLPAISFDWANMADNYTDTATNTQKTAVAQLMQYCGYSVKMRYSGLQSAADGRDIAPALTTYFDYNTSAMYVRRCDYNNAEWRNLIYYELENRRPVIYAGQSSSGGHAFVCDGYKYEDNEDMFHINWGSNGGGDGYFMLSLDPYYEQAVEYRYKFHQQAVVGIQPSTSTGTTNPDVTKHTIDMQLNSISVSKETISLGESVDITVSVTNNSADLYDADIVVFDDNYKVTTGKYFYIAPGETKECVFTICPEKEGRYCFCAAYYDIRYPFHNDSDCILQVKDQTPRDLSVTDVTTETAAVSWTNANDASAWNLRYLPMKVITEDFSDMDLKSSGWMTYNFGIYRGWRLSSDSGIDGSPCIVCYETYGRIKTPDFKFGGTVTFYAWGQDEHFSIHINNAFHPLCEYVTSLTPLLYTIDLSAYAGETGYLMIKHDSPKNSSNTSDSYLYIDDVTFYEPSDDWSTVNNVTEIPYVLTGLTAGTRYHVQVQTVNTDGGNWSDYIVFTTTKAMDDVAMKNVTVNDNEVDAWFTVDGIRFSEKPKRKGIYVHHGRKTIIK